MSISWVASRVLMKSDPPTYAALARYRGLPAVPKRQDELQALIEAYVPGVLDADRATGREALQLVQARLEAALNAGLV